MPRTRKPSTANMLVNERGNTVLSDFGRRVRNEPHKYIYKIKLYFERGDILRDDVMEWLRERYLTTKGKQTRYEVRTFATAEDKHLPVKERRRYADYVLLERFTPAEEAEFVLRFGKLSQTKVIRDGKLRRPRLSKEQKKEFDEMVNAYYLKVERERIALAEQRATALAA